MPREKIRSIYDGQQFEVRVGWQRDSDVQVGVEAGEGRSLYWALLESHVEMLGSEIRRIVAEANEPGTHPLGDHAVGTNLLNMLDVTGGSYQGVWSMLDRVGCNDLIRVVRRARDQAFGRDE